jgi:mono/diheme cytochrome c family protein
MRKLTTSSLCAALVGMCLSAQTVGAQDKALIEQGIKVYAAQKCSVCHSIEGKGKKTGPLDGPEAKLKKLSADEIRQWLVNPVEMAKKAKSTKKPVMKNYAKLPKEDIDALVAYMRSLK